MSFRTFLARSLIGVMLLTLIGFLRSAPSLGIPVYWLIFAIVPLLCGLTLLGGNYWSRRIKYKK